MEPNWVPLEEKLGGKRCTGFMLMGRINAINLCKHSIARMYLSSIRTSRSTDFEGAISRVHGLHESTSSFRNSSTKSSTAVLVPPHFFDKPKNWS
jgi:hypothetical protein